MENKRQKTILILGAGVYQVPLIKRARERGLRTIVASIPGNYPGFELADRSCFINTTDRRAVLEIAREEKIDAIATTGTDVAVISIGHVCCELGLPGISEHAARILTDKALMKEAFANGNVTTAQFERVASFEEAIKAAERIGLPVMLKIVDKSGSRGITKIDNVSQVKAAYEYAEKATDAGYMLVEKYIRGKEIGIDAFVQHGKVKLMLPHEKYVYQSGHTGIPIGHYCPMVVSQRLYANMMNETEKIIRCTGLDDCAVNIDAFVCEDDTVSVIEAAGRCGATGIPEVISGYTGRNYYDCILDNALGIEVEEFTLEKGRPTASLLLFSEKGGLLRSVRYCFRGKEYRNCNVEIPGYGSLEINVCPGDRIRAFQNGTDRIGQAVFFAETNEQLQTAVSDFRDSVRIEVDD